MDKIGVKGTPNKNDSKIPVLLSSAPLRRTGSLRMGSYPTIQEQINNTSIQKKISRHRSLQSLNTTACMSYQEDDDADSIKSFSSSASVCSSSVSQCDHTSFARNGTTFSGRSKRYILHCSPQFTETDDYLTPTQRTARTVRKLRNLLKEAQLELAEKDKEILRLTKEVVELRLLKVNLRTSVNKEEETKLDEEDLTQSYNTTILNDQLEGFSLSRYCFTPPSAQSLSDSGHFEDLNSSKETAHFTQNHCKIVALQRQHENEIRELKEKHNDRVDSLLHRITDVNDRYYALKPLYEECKEKVHDLHKYINELEKSSSQCQFASVVNSLEINCENKLKDKTIEVMNLKATNSKLQPLSTNADEFVVENTQLKVTEDNLCNHRQGDVNLSELRTITLDNSCQTENVQSRNETDLFVTGYLDEQKHMYSNYIEENAELKLKISEYVKKLEILEEEQQKEKHIYEQLFKKGIQAAKLSDTEAKDGEEELDKESSLIPELLNKLRIKQEELDNLKDKDYFSPDNLLSAKEAVSLWMLVRKGMYRRLLETRKQQPKNDPEMTLQFLKSAFYYFLTDRENALGHLTAIESILGFTDSEKANIDKAFLWR